MKVLELKKGDFQSFRKEVLKHLGEELKITYNGKYILWTFSKENYTNYNPTHIEKEEYIDNMIEKEILEISQHLIFGGIKMKKNKIKPLSKYEILTEEVEDNKEETPVEEAPKTETKTEETPVEEAPKTEEEKETPEIDNDIIIEVGQIVSDGHLIGYESTKDSVSLLIEDSEGKEVRLNYTMEGFIKLAKNFKVIKDKSITVVKDGEVKEFESVNDFHIFLLKETGKEKINKGLLYNLKNGKSKSCYGYSLYQED